MLYVCFKVHQVFNQECFVCLWIDCSLIRQEELKGTHCKCILAGVYFYSVVIVDTNVYLSGMFGFLVSLVELLESVDCADD